MDLDFKRLCFLKNLSHTPLFAAWVATAERNELSPNFEVYKRIFLSFQDFLSYKTNDPPSLMCMNLFFDIRRKIKLSKFSYILKTDKNICKYM